MVYRPMAFLPEWAVDGGKSRAMAAFNAARLQEYIAAGFITYTPPRRDDDKPAIYFAKSHIDQGKECIIVTNDNFADHIRGGDISTEWFNNHVVSYQWIGNTNRLMLNLHDLPRTVDMPCLQNG